MDVKHYTVSSKKRPRPDRGRGRHVTITIDTLVARRSSLAVQYSMVPFFVVSMLSSWPDLKKKAFMFWVRNWRAWGSMTFRP